MVTRLLKRLARRILREELLAARRNYMALDRRYCRQCQTSFLLRQHIHEMHKTGHDILVSIDRRDRWEP